jgi:hypothetical protein
MALAIFHFEYRYVDKLNDGSKPFHKDYLQKIVQNSWIFKTFCYSIGFLCLSVPLLLQVYNASCMNDDNVQDQMYYLDKDIQYCWKNVGAAIYYSTSPIVFYAGVSLLMLPSLIGMSSILKPMLNSHLWHILEELTFQAYLLQYLVVIWFFASREQNTLISKGYLITITISSCILAYCIAVPFYLLVERPFRNFLDLILFPKSSIFKKQKDLEDSDDSTESDDGKPQVVCGFCNDEPCDC